MIEKPVRFGQQFKKPSASVLRRHRAKSGEKMLESHELRRMLDALDGKEVETGRTDEETGKPETVTVPVNPVLRAMVLLGVNCAFTNKDCADLPLKAVNLEAAGSTSHGQRRAFPGVAHFVPKRYRLYVRRSPCEPNRETRQRTA